jgi:hypothetical protein
MDCYRERIAEIGKRLQDKSLGEVEAELNTNRYNYVGVGFGYNLKSKYPVTHAEALQFTQTPEFDELVAISKDL